MKSVLILVSVICISWQANFAQEATKGLRGDPAAIAEARAMVETMGGVAIWSQLKSIHFVHEWFFYNRVDSYIENEILDLTGPRAWIEMKSEIYHRIRVTSPEHKYWNIINGEFTFGTDEESHGLVTGAPFHWTRIARGIAVDDPFYEVRFGTGEFRDSRQLEFFGPNGQRGAYLLLNAKKEPWVWGVDRQISFKYTFGPMKRFGNLRVPHWAVTGNGAVTYEMISLVGSNQAPDPSLFLPPREFRKLGKER